MSIDKKRGSGAKPSGGARASRLNRLPGTVGVMKPRRGIALLERWRLEGDAEEDREADEAVREEIERARA